MGLQSRFPLFLFFLCHSITFCLLSIDTSWHPSVMLLGDPGRCIRVCAQRTMVKPVFSSPHSFIMRTHWDLFSSRSEFCCRQLTCVYRGTRTPFLCVCALVISSSPFSPPPLGPPIPIYSLMSLAWVFPHTGESMRCLSFCVWLI